MQKLKMSFFHLLESLFTCFLKDKTLHNHWDYAGFTVPYYNIPSNNRELQLYGNSAGDVVMSVAEEIEENWEGCHMADLQLEELEEMPEIAYKLGIVPHDWKNETAGIWADNELEEAVPLRGSSFYSTSNGGAGALDLNNPRSDVYYDVSFRSALFLESWELVTDLLKAGAEAHAGAQDE